MQLTAILRPRSCPDGMTQKLLRVMKLTAILLIAACLQVSARTEGQAITLSLKNTALQKVLTEIEKQSGYNFIYGKDLISKADRVSIDVKDASLDKVLGLLFENQPLAYKISENYIVLSPKSPAVLNPVDVTINVPPPPIDIKGRITNADGEPLVGATVTVKGSDRSISTDADGRFSLNVSEGEVLVITFVEYETKEVRITSKGLKNIGSSFFISLVPLVTSLNDVIINKGYYTQKQRYNTGNVFRVDGKDIQKQPVSDPLLALEGRVPGLYIQQASGIPGAYSKIMLRGQNSIYDPTTKLGTANDPLYVIDGVPYSSQSLTNTYRGGGAVGKPGNSVYDRGAGLSPFNNLNPADIENIEVLKDADATAIYGSRGANGVILITTKKGKPGSTKFDINVFSGAGKVTRKQDLLNTQQYLQMRHEALQNDGQTPGPYDYDITGDWDSTRYTDWQKVLIGNTARFTNAQVNISGGNNATQFMIGGGYSNQTTVFPGDYNDIKASAHINITHQSADKRFKVQAGASYLNDNNKIPRVDLTTQVTLAPDAPAIYDAFGNINWGMKDFGFGIYNTWTNPLAYTTEKAIAVTNNLTGNLNMAYTVLPGLEIKSSFGYTHSQMNQSLLTPSTFTAPPFNTDPLQRQSFFATNSVITWIVEPQVAFHKPFGKGVLDALIGTTIHENQSHSDGFDTKGYSSDALISNPLAASFFGLVQYGYTQYKYNALYARVGYIWDEKYILNLTANRDGSSRFGPGKQFGNFGAVGGGWIFSKEHFIEKGLRWLSFGKLRASYGITGNDGIQDYGFLSTYSPASSTYQGVTSLDPKGVINPDVHWEQVRKFEAGLELGFLKDRINLSLSFYRNRTGNQLINYILPTTTGFTQVQQNLAATIQNTGWELALNSTNIRTKNFTWSSSFNTSFPRNKLVAFDKLATSPYASTYIIGQSLFLSRVFHYTGVDPSTGLYTFATKNPNGVPGNADYIIKNKTQSLFGGLNNSVRYKKWSLDLFIQMVKQTANNSRGGFGVPGSFDAYGFSGPNQPAYIFNRWQKPGQATDIQKFSTSGLASTLYNDISKSDAAVTDDASFVRLKNVALSYELPAGWRSKAHLQNARVYLQCQNLFTITKFKGMDPETGAGLSLPPLRMITLGAQLTF